MTPAAALARALGELEPGNQPLEELAVARDGGGEGARLGEAEVAPGQGLAEERFFRDLARDGGQRFGRRLRRPFPNPQAPSSADGQVVAALLEGRHVLEARGAAIGHDGQHLELAALRVRRRLAGAARRGVHVPCPGAAPGQGTWMKLVPVFSAMAATARCQMEPTPESPSFTWSGRFFASAMRSSIMLRGESVRTITAAGSAFNRATMRKSSAEKRIWLRKGRMASSTVTTATLWPSGRAFSASFMPIAPLAPAG